MGEGVSASLNENCGSVDQPVCDAPGLELSQQPSEYGAVPTVMHRVSMVKRVAVTFMMLWVCLIQMAFTVMYAIKSQM